MLAEIGGLQLVVGILAVEHVGPEPPTARQNISANGSTANGSGFCASNARAVATNNAVEPTLVVMSQLSSSVRTATDPTRA